VSGQWLQLDEWMPPGVRTLGNDYMMQENLRNWTRGKPLTPGLAYVYPQTDEGTLSIHYNDEYRASWAVYARQTTTDRDVSVAGYSSLESALEDCIEMARSYEAEDVVFAALPGLA